MLRKNLIIGGIMNRSTFRKYILTVPLTFMGGTWSMAAEKPNILFIMTDQQHGKMMSCSGNQWLSTPAFDGLAKDGIRFEKALIGGYPAPRVEHFISTGSEKMAAVLKRMKVPASIITLSSPTYLQLNKEFLTL